MPTSRSTPLTATNPVGATHTLTGHVNVSVDSVTYTNAPAGTLITFSLVNAGGASAAFVGGVNTCLTIGTTGSCTVQITSPTAGSTTITATTTVNGLTRTTGDTNAGDSASATKTWQQPDANISISPLTATNPVGATHTLTGHVNVSVDSVTYTNAPAGTLITFSLVNAGGASAAFVGGVNTCLTIGTTGSCTVQITSPTAGSTTITATTTVNGLTRTTGDTNAGDSASATKTWQQPDANISISPLTATNPVGATHTLTGHVNVSVDSVTYTNAPAGTLITFSLVNAGGASAAFVGGVNTCLTIGTTGSCTVQITSPTAGSTTITATTTVGNTGSPAPPVTPTPVTAPAPPRPGSRRSPARSSRPIRNARTS